MSPFEYIWFLPQNGELTINHVLIVAVLAGAGCFYYWVKNRKS